MNKKTNMQDLKNLNIWSIFKLGGDCWVWNQFSAVSAANAVSASSAVNASSAASAASAVSTARTKLVLPEQS